MTPILATLNKFPPFIVFAMGKVRVNGHRRGLTIDEVAGGTGMSRNTILRILARLTWDRVPMENVSDFFEVCDVDPFNGETLRRLQRTVQRDKPLSHLTKRQRKAFERRLKLAGWL